MAIGRISGPLLKDNLTRNGVNLAVETDLLYLLVSNSDRTAHNVGIKTTNPAYPLDVNGAAGIAGNLNLTGSGTFVVGDFDNATILNRTLFKTRTTNASTGIYAVPNGTNTAASWQATNAVDPTNASKILIATNGSTDVQLVSGRNGTGTFLPLSFYTNGASKMQLDTSGNLGIGNTTPSTIGISGYTRLVVGNGASSIDGLTIVPSNTGGIQFTDTAATEKGYIKWNNGTGALTFGTAATTRVTISDTNVVMSGTGALQIPSGTTGNQPGTPTVGMVRYNSTINQPEMYLGSTWQSLTPPIWGRIFTMIGV
jgi:hypothetical protein